MIRNPGDASNSLRTPTRFCGLFRQHLRDGTRPDRTAGALRRPWTNKEFAYASGVPVDTLRRWLSGARCPKYTIGIERALFGSSPNHEFFRRQLREAHAATRGHPRLMHCDETIKTSSADIEVSILPLKYNRFFLRFSNLPGRLVFKSDGDRCAKCFIGGIPCPDHILPISHDGSPMLGDVQFSHELLRLPANGLEVGICIG